MTTTTVDKLPLCAECISNGVNEPKDAAFKVKTPMKVTLALCDEHFMNYVEARLGTDTVSQLALVQKAGGRNNNKT